MPKTYSTYEAKARLSELLDRVRKGDVVTITHRGQPVAEVRPIERSKESLSTHLDTLRRSGIISHRDEARAFKPLGTRRGALRRFLESRE
ncbi:MAG TPA: type II toxin-antitoxin system prevent-host-death family antitoxin [Thermoanaerobaculia bacterium]|nr:type II toxin-antitoxin system prevent-host-death family antitoxin [Thermoanaerobaculia bacterium]